jgi:hypothetical protein
LDVAQDFELNQMSYATHKWIFCFVFNKTWHLGWWQFHTIHNCFALGNVLWPMLLWVLRNNSLSIVLSLWQLLMFANCLFQNNALFRSSQLHERNEVNFSPAHQGLWHWQETYGLPIGFPFQSPTNTLSVLLAHIFSLMFFQWENNEDSHSKSQRAFRCFNGVTRFSHFCNRKLSWQAGNYSSDGL